MIAVKVVMINQYNCNNSNGYLITGSKLWMVTVDIKEGY